MKRLRNKKSLLVLILCVITIFAATLAGVFIGRPTSVASAEVETSATNPKEDKDEELVFVQTEYASREGKLDDWAKNYLASIGRTEEEALFYEDGTFDPIATAGMEVGPDDEDLAFDDISYEISGDGSQSNPYLMSTAADWTTVIARASSATNRTYVRLTANIVCAQNGNFATTPNAVNAAFYVGCFNVPEGKYITLDIGSYTINRNRTTYAANGRVMNIYGDLELNGTTGQITGGKTSSGYGGGFMVNGNNAKFTMNGGHFYENHDNLDGENNTAGGVWVGGGTFIMNNGEISYCYTHGGRSDGGGVELSRVNGQSSGNKATMYMYNGLIHDCWGQQYTGGVCVYPGYFYMYGGEIYNCSCGVARGAGVLVWGALSMISEMYMYGGKIHHNTAVTDGGGIGTNEGNIVALYGGEIYANKCGANYTGGGIFFTGNALSIGGPVKIYDNHMNNAANTLNNLYLGGTVIIDGPLEDASGNKCDVGLYVGTIKTFTSGYGRYNPTVSASEYFSNDYGNLVYDSVLTLGTKNEAVFSNKIPIPYIVNSGGYEGKQASNYYIYMRYTASPINIDLCIDYGPKFMIVSNMSTGVSLVGRVTGKAITVSVTDIGVYYVDISPSSALTWTDNTKTAKRFTIEVCPPVDVPTIKEEEGTDNSLRTKAVIYNLDGNTITFEHLDTFQTTVSYSGMTLVSQTNSSASGEFDGSLTLRAYDANTYTITFSLKGDRAFCWNIKPGYPDEPQQFYLIIQTRLVDKPQLIWQEGVSGNTFEVEYDGTFHEIDFAPTLERYVVWSAAPSGVSQVFHLASALRLQVKDLGTYIVKLAPVNNNVKWMDTTGTPQEFTITVLPKSIPIPFILENTGVNADRTVREVTYNGVNQIIIMSPIDFTKFTWQLSPGLTITNNANGMMTVAAINANTYTVTFHLSDAQFRWEDKTRDDKVMTLIIKQKPIKRPVLIAEDDMDGSGGKEVTYDPGEDGKGVFQTMTILNASSTELTWHAPAGMTQQSWFDTTLVLRAMNAGSYTIYFTPNDNYCWEDSDYGSPYFELLINKKRIALPTIAEDESYNAATGLGVNKAENRKYVQFAEGVYHTFKLTVGYQYEVACEAAVLNRAWPEDSRDITYSGINAATYTISVTPGDNFIWVTENSDTINFYLTIKPIVLQSPKMYYFKSNNTGTTEGQLEHYVLAENDNGHSATVVYSADEQYMYIADCKETDVSWNFMEGTHVLAPEEEAGYGLKLLEWDNVNNRIRFYGRDANTYVVRLSIKNTNYNWENNDIHIEYYFIIDAYALGVVELKGGTGNAVKVDMAKNSVDTVYDTNVATMTMQISTMERLSALPDSNWTMDELVDVILPKGMEIVELTNTGVLTVRAYNAGVYVVSIDIANTNYRWNNGREEPYEFTLIIEQHKISAPSYHLVNVAENGSVETVKTSTDRTLKTTFTNENLYVEFRPTATDINNFVDTDYSVQISVTGSEGTTWVENIYNDNLIRMYALHAGTYTFTVKPTDNYQWQDGTQNAVAFTFTIETMKVAYPTLHVYDETCDTDTRTRTVSYSGEEQKLSVDLAFPAAIKVVSAPDMTEFTEEEDEKILTYTAVDAGTYVLTLGLSSSDYEWAYYITEYREFKLVIGKQQVAFPELYVYGDDCDDTNNIRTVTYERNDDNPDGVQHVISVYFPYLNTDAIAIESAPGLTFTATEDTDIVTEDGKGYISYYAINAGVYVLTLKLSNTNNYVWAAGVSSPNPQYTLHILKKKVELPTFHDYQDTDPLTGKDTCDVQNKTRTLVYNRDNKILGVDLPDPYGIGVESYAGLTQCSVSRSPLMEFYAVNVNTYTLVLRLDNTNNYEWKDGAATQNPEFYLVILKKSIKLPEMYVFEDGSVNKYEDTRTVPYFTDTYQWLTLITSDPFAIGVRSAAGMSVVSPAETATTWLTMGENNYKQFYFMDEDGNPALDGDGNPLLPEGMLPVTYAALNSGTYTFTICLSNAANYQWDGYQSETKSFKLVITPKSLALPTAYLNAYDEAWDSADFDGSSTSQDYPLNDRNSYTQRLTYDTDNHVIYFFGNAIKDGDINFTITYSNRNNTVGSAIDAVTHSEDGIARFIAKGANEYTITLSFKTPNYYWDGDQSATGSKTFRFIIWQRQLSVPTIDGNAAAELVNNAKHQYFEYTGYKEADPYTNPETDELIESWFSIFILGFDTKYSSFTVSDENNVYACINVADVENHLASLFMGTLDGVANKTYYVEFNVNSPEDIVWGITGNTTDSIAKRIYITINKKPVAAPTFVNNSVTDSQFYKYSTYTGISQQFQLQGVTDFWINYQIDTPDTLTVLDYEDTDGVDGYKDLLSIESAAPAGTYQVIIKLKDANNMQWAGLNSTANLTYNFVINKVLVDKPVIHIGASGADGVVGNTKTITYNYEDQLFEIDNYINDVNNRWMSMAVISNTFVDGGYIYPEDDCEHDFGKADGEQPAYGDECIICGFKYPCTHDWDPDNGVFTCSICGECAHDWDDDNFTCSICGECNHEWDPDNNNECVHCGEMKPLDVLEGGYRLGILRFSAQLVGEYIVRITLSDNAQWADGSSYVDLRLVIEKLRIPTPYIVVNPEEPTDAVSGLTKTLTYNMQDQFMSIARFDGSLMGVDNIDGFDTWEYDENDLFNFYAINKGVYTVTLKIFNFDNVRWADVATETMTFTFTIKTLALNSPEGAGAQYFVNENEFFVDDDIRNMSAQYDGNVHTMLLRYLDTTYMEWEETTKYAEFPDNRKVDPEDPDSAIQDEYKLATKYYNNVFKDGNSSNNVDDNIYKVKDVYGYNPKFEDNLITSSGLIDANSPFFTMQAKYTGTYTITVWLKSEFTGNDNVSWVGDAPVDEEGKITITFTIAKQSHEAPVIAAGYSTSQEYSGTYVDFRFDNAINGKDENNQTVSAQFEDVTIPDEYYRATADAELTGVATDKNEYPFEIASWYNGHLTVHAIEIGYYTFRISITEPDIIEWSNRKNDTYIDFTVVITRKTLTPEIKFISEDNSELNAEFQKGSTSWPRSEQVYAQVTLKGIVVKAIPGTSEEGDPTTTFDVVKNNPILGSYILVSNAATGELDPLGLSTLENHAAVYSNPVRVGNTDAWVCDITYTFVMPTKLATASYYLYIQHDDDPDKEPDKYVLETTRFRFSITPDPAPFKSSMLFWQYDTGAGNYVDITQSTSEDDRYDNLVYLTDGGLYTFNAMLKEEYMKDSEGNAYENLEAALNALQVRLVSYSGSQVMANAGKYEVSITIAVLNPEEYYFPTTTYTLYYTIKPAKYNLSEVIWNYSDASDSFGSESFVYTGSAHTVSIEASSMPRGLSVISYSVSGFSANSQIYVGDYTTAVTFVSNSTNYMTPIMGDDDTYEGSFNWTVNWKIEKAPLEVDWKENFIAGTAIPTVPTLKAHSDKVEFVYEWLETDEEGNYIDADGNIVSEENARWIPVTSLTHFPGVDATFRVNAKLKENEGNPATDYNRNYYLKFVNELGVEYDGSDYVFILLGNDYPIAAHVEIDGRSDSVYYYKGAPFVAVPVIDMDSSGGLVQVSDIVVTYYSAVNYDLPLAGAPKEIGSYKVLLTIELENSGGLDQYFYILDPEFYFVIQKGDFDSDKIYWQYTHEESDGTVTTAKYDFEQEKWINEKTGTEIEEFVYNGISHDVSLVSSLGEVIITVKNNLGTDAGTYTSEAELSFDTDKWNNPEIPTTFTWTIKKATLDLSLVKWSDEGEFTYTRESGKAVEFHVELINVPDYLKSKITYKTQYSYDYSGLTDDAMAYVAGNSGSAVGYYRTMYVIEDVTNPNYQLGVMPSFAANPHEWTIVTREITVPEENGSWPEFDGNTHNLLSLFGIEGNWEDYFTVTAEYKETSEGNYAAYAGMGWSKYDAYNAGYYQLNFALNSGINTDEVQNVVWFVPGGSEDGSNLWTTENQSARVRVDKTTLEVNGWNPNYAASTVKLTSGASADKFICYTYEDADGKTVTLDEVLASVGNETFYIIPKVKEPYDKNVNLTFVSADLEKFEFVTPPFVPGTWVSEKPYIYSYTVDGKTYELDSAMQASGNVYVYYTGKEITFNIYHWKTDAASGITGFEERLDVVGGSDLLTQTDPGKYSITFTLKPDMSWGGGPDVDRKPVTLTFEIKMIMLDIPNVLSGVTYNGDEINIIQASIGDAAYDKLMTQYADFVEISGLVANKIGTYELKLSIIDQYRNAVRWNNGSTSGVTEINPFTWKVNPIVLLLPELDPVLQSRLVYNGKEHSVYEVLKGYGTRLSEEFINLMQYVNLALEGSRNVNAGEGFKALFALPDDNYVWSDNSTDKVEITWSINKQRLELSNLGWDYTEPFTYTRENGKAVTFTVSLTGLPDYLKNSVVYTTNGVTGNGASNAGTYKTSFALNTSGIDSANYELGSLPEDLEEEITWVINRREITVPVDNGLWKVFDGNAHDLLWLIGIPEGWENYFDVSVEYSYDGETFGRYRGYNNSLYQGYSVGSYRLNLSISDGINGGGEPNVVWFLGVEEGGDEVDVELLADEANFTVDTQQIVIDVEQLVLTVVDWDRDYQYSTIIFESNKPDTQPEIANIMDMYYYVIREKDTNKVVTQDEVGLAANNDEFNIRVYVTADYDGFVIIRFAEGVENPYEFQLDNFEGQEIRWIPLPVLQDNEKEFTAEEQEFKINWSDYAITNALRDYYWKLGVNLDDKNYFIYESVGSLKQTKAGKYTVVLRFVSGVNLSWYDPREFKVDSDGNLVNLDGTPVGDYKIDRASKTYAFEITVKHLELIDLSIYEAAIRDDLIYSGKEQSVIEGIAVFDELLAKYGNLITIKDYSKTDAGEYQLSIELTDPESSCWSVGTFEYVTNSDGRYGFHYIYDENTRGYVLRYGYYRDDIFENFNGGDYDLSEVVYKRNVEFEVEYVAKAGNVTADGYPNRTPIQINGNFVYNDKGQIVVADFVVDELGKSVTYDLVDGKYVVNASGEGEYVARFVFDGQGNKVEVTKYESEYVHLWNNTTTGQASQVNGEYVRRYIVQVDGKYVLREYQVNSSGGFIRENNRYLYDDICEVEIVGDARYVRNGVEGAYTYTEAEDGTFVYVYKLDKNGNRVETIDYVLDENGNKVVDVENSKVKIATYVDYNQEYKIDWKINKLAVNAPSLDLSLPVPTFSGDVIEVKDFLLGFDDAYMAVTEGGAEINAGSYMAVITFSDNNHVWADTDDDEIVIPWKIDRAVFDLSDVVWDYTQPFTYTRADGKPVIFTVNLVGLPTYLQEKVQYTTNGTVSHYAAGVNAGKYHTEVDFVDINPDNCEILGIPDSIKSLDWRILKREITIPQNSKRWQSFDFEVHDLTQILGIQSDWANYYTITVQYSHDGVNYVDYEGYDGEPLMAYGAGFYKFSFELISDVNSKYLNVVWYADTGVTPPVEPVEPPVEPALPEDSLNLDDITYLDGEEGEEGEFEEGEGEEGEEPEKPEGPGDDDIAEPEPDDGDEGGSTTLPDIIVEVEKLKIHVTGWHEDMYNSTVDIEEGEAYRKYIEYILMDTAGNIVTVEQIIANGPGHTYFVVAKIVADSSENVALEFADGIARAYDFSTEYPRTQTPTFVDYPDFGELKAEFTGKPITFILDGWDTEYSKYLTIVEAEGISDSLTQTGVGTYSITICFKDDLNYSWRTADGSTNRKAITITFEITKKSITLPDPDAFKPVYYTGSEIDFTAQLQKIMGNDYVIAVRSSTQRYIDAGTYQVKLALNAAKYNDWLYWADGYAVNEDGTITVTWEVLPAVLSGSWSAEGILSIECSFAGDFDDILIYQYRDKNTKQPITIEQMLSNGSYEVMATLKAGYEGNFEDPLGLLGTWHDYHKSAIVTLNKFVPEFERQEIEYTGSAITFVLKDWAEYIDTVNIVEGASALTQTNVGEYTITLTGKSGYVIRWKDADGTNRGSTVTLTFRIIPKVISLPDVFEVQYTGTEVNVAKYIDEYFTVFVNIDEASAMGAEIGEYLLKFTLKPEYSETCTIENLHYDTDGVTVLLPWKIVPAVITGEWRTDGRMELRSSYVGGYDSVVNYTYTDANGNRVTYASLEKGKTYTAEITLIDTAHFVFAKDLKTKYEFTFDVTVNEIERPALEVYSASYTGNEIVIKVLNWNEHLEVICTNGTVERDTIRVTNAGEYTIVVRIIDAGVAFMGTSAVDMTLKFTVNKAEISGTWKDDGTMDLKSTYEGDYSIVIEYFYYDENNNLVSREDLVKGQTYTAVIAIRSTAVGNFVFAQGTQLMYKFTYTPTGMAWWWWLIIALIILVIIIVIIIIIVMKKKKKKEDENAEEAEEGEEAEDGEEGDEDLTPEVETDGDDDYSVTESEDDGEGTEETEDTDYSDIYGSDDGGDSSSDSFSTDDLDDLGL